MSNIQNLKERAQGIQGETAQGQNTADRVGGLLVDMCSELGTVEENLTIINNKIIQGGGGDTVEVLPVTIPSPNKLVATIKVNGISKEIYAPSNNGTTPSPSESGANYVSSTTVEGLRDSGSIIGTVNVITQTYQNGSYTSSSQGYDIKVDADDIKPLVAESVIWDQKYKDTTGEHIADITIGNATTHIYAPKYSGTTPTPGPDTPTPDSGTQEAIDEINRTIEAANERANSESERLDNLLALLGSDIQNAVTQMKEDANWIQEHWTEGAISHFSGWDENTKTQISRIGTWLEENGNITTEWSDMKQAYNNITASVNKVYQSSGGLTEYLQSAIREAIVGDNATIDLGAKYAKTNDVGTIVKWLYSGLNVNTNANATWTDLVSAATTENGQKCIADLHTAVDLLTGTVTSSLASKFNERISELYTEATNNGAETGLFAKFKKDSDDIATIVTYATNNATGTTIASKFQNYQAGLVTKTGLADALAGLTVQDLEGKSLAAITAKVKEGYSEIELTADKIEQIANSICLKMDSLAIVSGADGDKKGAVFTTFTDGTNPLGFEIAAGDIEFNSDGTWKSTSKMVGRYRFTYFYALMPKILSYNILLANPGTAAGSFPSIDVPNNAQIRWFASINGDGNGDQFGYTDNTKNQHLGYIEFNGNMMTIHGDLNVVDGVIRYKNNIIHQ